MTETPGGLPAPEAALVLMDYQTGVLSSMSDADLLLGRASEAIHTVRRHGGRVVFVRMGLSEADYRSVVPGSPMAERVAAYGRALDAESADTAIHEKIAPLPEDMVVRKCRVGAFSTTDLDERLRAQDIKTLLLAGLTTSGVVLTTVREAFDRDYRVYVLADACSDRDLDVHEFLVEKVFPRQAVITTVAELDSLLSAPGDPCGAGG